ncbi:MAG: c-type cytochrome [Verrucomicrobiales bacterium]|nr:c-type cytochrome [Verrucomicrobiales bacterium]
MTTFLLLAGFLGPFTQPTQGQLGDDRPQPEWLAGAPRYETTFDLDTTPLVMAVLWVIADREVAVWVNDQPAGKATSPEQAASLDLTTRLRPGVNHLSLRAADGQPVRAAALLELRGDLAVRAWLATGAGWKVPEGVAPHRAPIGADPATNPFDPARTVDAYNSWKLAQRDKQSTATDPAAFSLPPGFRAELIRSAGADEDSWVAMSFDPEGRIVLAREKKGLLRLSSDGKMETIDDTLLECRGLLHTHGVLYAHANNSKALYRLRDGDGDGTYEEKEEILRTEGGVGHGRNHLKLGPDGHLWIAFGNNVILPPGLASTSPLSHYAEDQVLPNPWDPGMFDGNVTAPAGHILRLPPDGGPAELIAGGLRNPVDIAFNRNGELFTFDADMEWDIRAPWYMPNRVVHLVSASDFGWRRGTGRQPDWHVDTLPSVVDIGLGSPTAVFFGHGAKMPPRYEEALLICDWAYGRILAIHLEAAGASYTGEIEPFVSGRPLNVTDGCIGPDGALWFITGGRGTQSGLYRITYDSPVEKAVAKSASNENRTLRHRLESLHRGIPEKDQKAALDIILPQLESSDRFIRHAARVALEKLPGSLWQERLLSAPDGWSALLGCLALARTSDSATAERVFQRLGSFDWARLDTDHRLALLRVVGVALARFGDPPPAHRNGLIALLEPAYPAEDHRLNRELCPLLIRLGSTAVLARTVTLLRNAETPEDLVFYPMQLRYLKAGWTADFHREVFVALDRASRHPDGGRNFTKAIQDLRTEHLALLTPELTLALDDVLPKSPAAAATLPQGPVVKAWKLADLTPRLDEVGRGRSFQNGKAATIAAGCAACHRVSPDPAVPAGIHGPDLVQVAARFGRRDLLEHILDPAKVVEEKYRIVTVTRTDGTTVTGTIESADDERILLKPNPLSPDTIGIGLSQIAKREESTASPMPAGLLNSLNAAQILDLLAFLEAGGNSQHRNFQP